MEKANTWVHLKMYFARERYKRVEGVGKMGSGGK